MNVYVCALAGIGASISYFSTVVLMRYVHEYVATKLQKP
jgi:hypothetical protein